MTRAVRAFAEHAFAAWGLNRLEIRVAVGNHRSSAIPRRLGFVDEGTLRQVERFGDEDRFEDLEIYAMLAADRPGAGRPSSAARATFSRRQSGHRQPE
jgi:ribosomal-protein-serine acetyltransferase